MEGQKVQEYTVETGPNGLPVARLGRVHNLITFISSGKQKIHYLDGKWVDDGRNPIDESEVPEDYKRQVGTIPFKPALDFEPDVMRNCEFCEFSGPSREYATHLANVHIRRNIREAAVEIAPATVSDTPLDDTASPRGVRPEDLPDGNRYATDADGFVILNVDGSYRKKAGRPRKEEAE